MTDTVIVTISSFVFLIVIALIFRPAIQKASKVKFSLTGIEFEASVDEFKNIFKETYSNLIKREHIEFFCTLFSYKKEPTVLEAEPKFNRESPEWCKSSEGKEIIGMFRALRGLGLIKPREDGPWESWKHVEITKFGKEFKRHIKGKC